MRKLWINHEPLDDIQRAGYAVIFIQMKIG